jgi:hypothetical protein
MKTKKEYEFEIVVFFNKYIRDSLKKKLLIMNHASNFVKCPYVYFDKNAECEFYPNEIIDFVKWDVINKKFIEIEYPWDNEKGELQYNIIKL